VVHVQQGRVNFTTLTDLPEGAPVMTGVFSINNRTTVILFDSGASHSFLHSKYATSNELPYEHTRQPYLISTLGGKVASNQLVRQVPLRLGSRIYATNLITLGLQGVDVTLGMNWMTQHRVLLNIPFRAVEIDSPTHGMTTLYLPSPESTNPCTFAMAEPKLEAIPVVCEYPDVFPDELPGMPPDRDIELVIELQPGIAPISKRPYRMPPKELAELKIQLQELLDKGFIRPSSSP
jgi:hypothetical protein